MKAVPPSHGGSDASFAYGAAPAGIAAADPGGEERIRPERKKPVGAGAGKTPQPSAATAVPGAARCVTLRHGS